MIQIKPLNLSVTRGRRFRASAFDPFLEEIIDTIERRFKIATMGWSKPVSITRRKPHTESDKRIGWAGAIRNTKNNAIFSYISFGTGPRAIRSSTGTTMWFQPGYKAATSPGSYISSKKSRWGPFIGTHVVHKHRIEPREFDKTIAESIELTLPSKAQKFITSELVVGLFD